MKPNEVKSWVAFMREHGIRRLVISGLEVELGSPSSSYSAQNEPPVVPQGVFEDATGSVCACGHPWATDHDPVAGCLHGCSHETCSSTGGASNV